MKPQPSLKKPPVKAPAERVVKDIRRQTRRHFSAEDKIRIVLDGLRGEGIGYSRARWLSGATGQAVDKADCVRAASLATT